MTLGLTGANRALDVSSSLKLLFSNAAECELRHSRPNKSKQLRRNIRTHLFIFATKARLIPVAFATDHDDKTGARYITLAITLIG
jgi:hypothetical protein